MEKLTTQSIVVKSIWEFVDGHAIGGCKTALLESRYNWRHDSVLLNIYRTIKSQVLQAFVDTGYPNPLIITGNEQRLDFAIVKSDDLLLLGLTVSFETNIKKNFDRKAKHYQQLLSELSNKFNESYVSNSMPYYGEYYFKSE